MEYEDITYKYPDRINKIDRIACLMPFRRKDRRQVCSVKAKTRNEALSLVRDTVSTIIRRSEIVLIDVPVEARAGTFHNNAPWELFALFKDDQTWGRLFDEIEYDRMQI